MITTTIYDRTGAVAAVAELDAETPPPVLLYQQRVFLVTTLSGGVAYSEAQVCVLELANPPTVAIAAVAGSVAP